MTKRSRITLLPVAIAALVFALPGSVGDASAASPSGGSRAQADRATQLLFEAVYTNDFASAEAAVAAGASIQARDRWNSTPIELAIDKGYFRIAHFLVSVRNTRQQADGEVINPPRSGETAPARSAAPPQRVAPTPTPAPTAAADAPSPAWPNDRPNPFDPTAPAFGTGLPVVTQARGGSTGLKQSPDTGPILVTDTPTAGGEGSVR